MRGISMLPSGFIGLIGLRVRENVLTFEVWGVMLACLLLFYSMDRA